MKHIRVWSPEELLRFIVGVVLSLTLTFIVATVLYSLVFVSQPMDGQAPNDAEFFKLINPIATFIVGALAGLMAGQGIGEMPSKKLNE
jgi:membrane-associated protease RseP (regulator of RpoE activity)